MNENQEEIRKIADKETRIKNFQNLLGLGFFILAIAVISMIVKLLMTPVADPRLAMEHGQAVVARILIVLIIFAITIIGGYLWYKLLSKKLDRLWEMKKALF